MAYSSQRAMAIGPGPESFASTFRWFGEIGDVLKTALHFFLSSLTRMAEQGTIVNLDCFLPQFSSRAAPFVQNLIALSAGSGSPSMPSLGQLSIYSAVISFAFTILFPLVVSRLWMARRQATNRFETGSASKKSLRGVLKECLAGRDVSFQGDPGHEDEMLALQAMAEDLSGEKSLPLTEDQKAAVAQLFREELAKLAGERELQSSGGKNVLIAFLVVLSLFGAANIIHYWKAIQNRSDLLLWGFGLFVSMIGGMFVQVLSSNYRSGRRLFSVGSSELAFPVLFSLVVFYPVWALTANGSQTLFSYYAAFLNGFFWEAVVSATRVPAGVSGT